METITIKQLPVIVHTLQAVGQEVERRLTELNIDNLVATEETVKALKEMRAELNKELLDYETDRKRVKQAIEKPYDDFNEVYKTEISERYTNAINKLKDKITSVEFRIKEEKQSAIQMYFDELCYSEGIDFIEFSKMGMDINLSTSEKAYKEKVNEFVMRVKDDVTLIESHEHRAEIMAEYKTCLNASKAITIIAERKTRERQEIERIKQAEWSRRKSLMLDSAMTLHSATNVFAFNDEIYVPADKVEKATKEEFDTMLIGFQQQIKDVLKSKVVEKPTEKPVEAKKPEPLPEPKVEEKLALVTATFEVVGTFPALKALGEYMRANNITYKNI